MARMSLATHVHDHDHDACVAAALRHAEQTCQARGQKLTPMRRHVLEALLASHCALGAYEIIDRLAAGMNRPAPITIYRALDFLIDNKLVHRIESRNAFLACQHTHPEDAAAVAFLICERCGTIGEVAAGEAAATLAAAAHSAGFAARLSVIEISGLCAQCRASEPA